MIEKLSTLPMPKLPDQPYATNPQNSLFGQIFNENATQFATRETADTLAQYLGGTVVDLSERWMGGSNVPQYQIQFGNGVMLNAGLLADRFTKYDTDLAVHLTALDAGITPVISQAPSTPGATVAQAPVISTQAASTPAASPVQQAAAAVQQTTTASSIATPQTAASAPAATDSAAADAKIADAALQFEGLMVANLLKAAQSGGEGWLGTGEDQSSSSVLEMAQEQFAKAIADQGGLGLSEMILRGLKSGASREQA